MLGHDQCAAVPQEVGQNIDAEEEAKKREQKVKEVSLCHSLHVEKRSEGARRREEGSES